MPTAAPPLVLVGVVHLAPIGPAIVTRDEFPDPQRLSLWLEVNGERRQQGSTADMLIGAARLIAYLSDSPKPCGLGTTVSAYASR